MRYFLVCLLFILNLSAFAETKLTLLVNPYGGLILSKIDIDAKTTGTQYLIVSKAQSLTGNPVYTTTTLTLQTNQDNPNIIGWSWFIKDLDLPGEFDSNNNLVGGFLTINLIVKWGSKIGNTIQLYNSQIEPLSYAIKDINPNDLIRAMMRNGNSAGWNNTQKKAVLVVLQQAIKDVWVSRLRSQFNNISM